VYSSFVGNAGDIDKQYVFPLYVNSKESTALRDTGNFGPVMVKRALIHKGAIIPGKHVYCRGIFDRRFVRHKLPVAKVKIRSPHFKFDDAVEIEVAVCGNACLPTGIDCNVGNSIFRQHPKLTDVFTIRPLSSQRQPAENSAQKQTASDPQRQSAGAVSNDDELTRAATPARESRVSTVMTRNTNA